MAREVFPPDLAARYEPVRELASGGFATVYLATQRGLDRSVAVKLLHEAVMGKDTERERFVNEARITAGLSHPNIMKVLDFGAASGVPWIVYEYLPGHSLADVLNEGPLDAAMALDAAMQVAAALAEAHAHGILHRDVKPGNVLVASPGVYKVGDFGLARFVEGGAALTATGVVVGTPAFFAPEILTGEPPSTLTDVYALGVMLYQLLIDDLPDLGPHAGTTFRKVWADRVAESGVEAELARRVEHAVVQLVAGKPEERTPSAEAARVLLEEAATGKRPGRSPNKRSGNVQVTPAASPLPRIPSRDGRRTLAPPTPLAGTTVESRGLAPLVGAAVLLLAAAGGVMLSRGQRGAVPPPAPASVPASAPSAAPARSRVVEEAVATLFSSISSANDRAHFVDTQSPLGDNVHHLENPGVVEPLYLRALTDAVRVVRGLREERVYGPQAFQALCRVADAVESSGRLLALAPHAGVQRWYAQLGAEVEQLEREAGGSAYVGAGARWIQGRRVAQLGRTGDRDARRHLTAAREFLVSAPDAAWRATPEVAEAVLQLSQSIHQHAKRLRSYEIVQRNHEFDLRLSALDVLAAVDHCVDAGSNLVKASGHALCYASHAAQELLAEPSCTPADRVFACRIARRVIAAARTRTQDAVREECRAALQALRCPEDEFDTAPASPAPRSSG